MTAQFDDAAIAVIFDKVVSYALATGRFDTVNQHEPKSTPGTGISCSVWVDSITPVRTSGLAATSGLVSLQARLYTSFNAQPYDMIDPNVLSATTDLMGALSGDFEFGQEASVREVDLLGTYGKGGLSAKAGYVEIDRHMMRVMTINIPIVINDMFLQVA